MENQNTAHGNVSSKQKQIMVAFNFLFKAEIKHINQQFCYVLIWNRVCDEDTKAKNVNKKDEMERIVVFLPSVFLDHRSLSLVVH